ncbi:hypothetical protein GLUCORHAEAF1_02430 [Komagataeibacter rhaeticus AF1]|nr:hypothetical protein GLUCORHAEAF1_02430 [Komagataeibacter rhaeticus AF1]
MHDHAMAGFIRDGAGQALPSVRLEQGMAVHALLTGRAGQQGGYGMSMSGGAGWTGLRFRVHELFM